MISPFGPRALVTSVWHVAHSSDWRTCSDSVGSNPVDDLMIVEIPRSMRNGPNTGRGARAFAGATTYPPVKLDGVPRF